MSKHRITSLVVAETWFRTNVSSYEDNGEILVTKMVEDWADECNDGNVPSEDRGLIEDSKLWDLATEIAIEYEDSTAAT